MKWSESAWESVADTFGAILELPFLRKLADGTLDPLCFKRYLEQDELYLGHYARHMAQLALLLPASDAAEEFRRFSRESLEAEKQMHQMLIDRFGMDSKPRESKVTRCYVNMEDSALATGNAAIALAALLPCAWVYNRAAGEILGSAKLEGNPYREWLLTYDDPAFTAGTQLMVDLADALASTDALRAQMSACFAAGTMLEYAFWDYGFRGEGADYEYLKEIKI